MRRGLIWRAGWSVPQGEEHIATTNDYGTHISFVCPTAIYFMCAQRLYILCVSNGHIFHVCVPNSHIYIYACPTVISFMWQGGR